MTTVKYFYTERTTATGELFCKRFDTYSEAKSIFDRSINEAERGNGHFSRSTEDIPDQFYGKSGIIYEIVVSLAER